MTCPYCGDPEMYEETTEPESLDYCGHDPAVYWTCPSCGHATTPVLVVAGASTEEDRSGR